MSSKQKHTPGPWEAQDNFVFAKYDFKLYVIDDAQSEANARLIAAAPDLLEALKDARWHLANLVGPSGGQAHERDMLTRIDFAIAKATGEST